MEDWKLNNNVIAPGESAQIKLNVGKLPSDSAIYIHALINRSAVPGPTVLVLGGVHGDEICGIEIVRQLFTEGVFDNLVCGNVIAIPLLNIFGFINFSRAVPDGKDVNRSFPGNSRGSLASRVARSLTRKILPFTDIVLDFHTGGDSRYNFPQIRYSRRDLQSAKLAEVFAAPFSIGKSEIAGSLRKETMKRGIPTLVYEGGEALRLDGFAIERGKAGVKRVLDSLGMIKKPELLPATTKHVKETRWIRAAEAGLFTWTKQSGQRIKKGEPLGLIHDPYGNKKIVVSAESDAYIIGHNNAPVVNVGDALFHLATAQ